MILNILVILFLFIFAIPQKKEGYNLYLRILFWRFLSRFRDGYLKFLYW